MTIMRIFLVFLSFLAITLTACKKDDDGDKNGLKNAFSYDGKTYSTPKALLEQYGENYGGGSHDFDFTFYSNGFTWDSQEEDFTGTGEAVYIDLNSSSPTEVTPGNYTVELEADREAFNIVFAITVLQYNKDTETGTELEVTAGSATVAKSGATYTVEYDFTVTGGKKVKGHFEGVPTIADYSKKKAIGPKIRF